MRISKESLTNEWFEFTKELKRRFDGASWIPLRKNWKQGNDLPASKVGYWEDSWAVGSAAFPPESTEQAEKLGWNDLGIGTNPGPYSFRDGQYKRCDEFQYDDKVTIGTNLVFTQFSAPTDKEVWIINPDLILALKLVREGNDWISPYDDFDVVIKETYRDDGKPESIDIKKEYLLDYLSARNLHLRLSAFRSRVMVVSELSEGPYEKPFRIDDNREGARFELLVRSLEEIYGGTAAVFKVWRTGFDHEVDAPVLDKETDENTAHESFTKKMESEMGFRIEGEYWREEWVKHNGASERIRGDAPKTFPLFITDTSGSTKESSDLNSEDIGSWLWFKPAVIKELLNHRAFKLVWYTNETGGMISSDRSRVHFGLNNSNLIVAYAYDIARLSVWQQKIWAAYNVVPTGGLGDELAASQVRSEPASTYAPEQKLHIVVDECDAAFIKKFGKPCFKDRPNVHAQLDIISRFSAADDTSLLTLAKDIYRATVENLDQNALRSISDPANGNLGSIKLIEKILEKYVNQKIARNCTQHLVALNELRIGDAHKTSSDLNEAYSLAGLDRTSNITRQAMQLIDGVGYTLWLIAETLRRSS